MYHRNIIPLLRFTCMKKYLLIAVMSTVCLVPQAKAEMITPSQAVTVVVSILPTIAAWFLGIPSTPPPANLPTPNGNSTTID